MRALMTISAMAFAITATAAAADAINTPGREPAELKVSTQGVDFYSPVSTQAFHARLASAARAVCDSGRRDLGAVDADRACARQALDEAVARIARPMLTAVHSGQPVSDPTRLADAR